MNGTNESRRDKVGGILNDILQLYYEDGLDVKEILIPKEWMKDFTTEDTLRFDPKMPFGKVIVFDSPSKHFLVIVSPR